MMRFITPIILLSICVTLFFMFTNPLYNDILSLRAQVASYNQALDNSKTLENQRDKLTEKYNTISQENLTKIKKLLPDNVDNIRLILEIEQVASPYGMTLKDVKYDATTTQTSSAGAPAQGATGGAVPLSSNKNYGVWNLEFSTTGTYNNFINFTKDLESNLRIVDISSVTFSSDTDSKTSSSGIYQYHFSIKTYWLKN